MPRACLVFGAESSGCRYLTRLFISAGCVGDGDHQQRMDDPEQRSIIMGQKHNVVWRRSVPCQTDHHWPNLVQEIIQPLREVEGYQLVAYVITRDWHCMGHSQVARDHVPSYPAAVENMRKAYRWILDHLHEAGVPYYMVSYESLVHNSPSAIRHLLHTAGFGMPQEYEEPKDENEKWYR